MAVQTTPLKMRIALCITELNIGGAERVFVDLATRLDTSRFEPVVYSLQSRPAIGNDLLVQRLEQANIPVIFLNGKSMFSLPFVLWRMRKLLKSQKPHLFQSFMFHANLLGRIAARLASVQHVFAGIRVAEQEKKWHLLLDCLTQSLVEKYVCVSDGVADFTCIQGKIPCDKIVVIPNGINLSEFVSCGKNRTRHTVDENNAISKKIMVIGRLHHQKGIDWLIKTTPLWLGRQYHTDSKADATQPVLQDRELLIVGDGQEKAQLQALAETMPCREGIHFLGHRNDIPQLLAIADLLVLPSRWEGMPNVVMQAMASGLPIVATEVEGISQLLPSKRGPNPQTCQFGETDQLVDRINAILHDKSLAQELGHDNQQRIAAHFTLDKMVEQYEQLWETHVR